MFSAPEAKIKTFDIFIQLYCIVGKFDGGLNLQLTILASN